jgi:hypothetical protein
VSIGGCVGLDIARQSLKCKSVVLLDTPFSSKKLWHAHNFLRSAIARQPDNQYVRRFALDIFGVTEQAAIERDYWNLLDEVLELSKREGARNSSLGNSIQIQNHEGRFLFFCNSRLPALPLFTNYPS